ncbi:trehalose-phosphatase [Polymorphobacter sp.]|uniref:trehalose-phosphatase n=1 Tax=Polymorphobacter sp. TaxID=1909290 RepID=UPI003F6E4CCA
MSAAPDLHHLPHPPADLRRSATLLLDFDGTLVDIADDPDGVIVDSGLIDLIAALAREQGDRLAIISGRSIAQLDALIGAPARTLAVSGSHGTEYRWQGYQAQSTRPASLDLVEAEMRAAAATHSGSIVERKSFGVALHYRLAPDFEPRALALARQLADQFGLVVQEGKMVAEVRVPGSDKGLAVRTLMARPEMTGTRPVFVGDDVTDEHGFEAARALGGVGILVGLPRPTAATYGLADPAAVRRWLAGDGK